MLRASLPRRDVALDRQILALALPAIGSGLTILAHLWVDTYWVGVYLGPAPLAALALATFTVWAFSAVSHLLGTGLTALVARYIGGGRPEGAAYVASQGFRTAVMLAVALAAGGWLLAPTCLAVAGAEPDVVEAGVPYIRIYFAGGFAILSQQAADAVFRGRGITWIPFVIACFGLTLNAILDPILILGWFGLPRLGLAGAATATVIAQASTAALSFGLLVYLGFVNRRRPSDEILRLRAATPLGHAGRLGLDYAVARRIFRVGVPVAISGVLFSVIYLALSHIVADAGGTAAQAGMGVGLRMEALAYIVGMGYAVAAASLVGRRLGADDPRGAERAAWRSVLQCAIVCGLWMLVLLFFPAQLASLLMETGPAHEHAQDFVRIVGLCLIPLAAEAVLEGAFGGAGMTVPPMIVTVSLTAIRIPVAWWFAVHLGHGPLAIWWTISLSAIARGVWMAVWFRRGTWKTRDV